MATDFTPWASLGGGALIGLSAVLLMASIGRIMGVTGIMGGIVLPASSHEFAWRAALVAGMVTAPALLALFGSSVEISVPSSTPLLVAGGLLIGFGATLGSGCTSGHGVCGMARLSVRSIIATLTFMAAAGITVFILRHVLGA